MTNTTIKWGTKYNDARESAKRLDLLKRDLSDLTPGTLLDLGANTGYFSHGLADAGFQVTAVEPPNDKVFDDRINQHRAWVQEPGDLPEGRWDVAIVLSVLHHIPRWREVLDEVINRTDHRVYVEVPHEQEKHPKWHGSWEQSHYLSILDNTSIIGAHYEVSRRYKRSLWRIDV